MVPVQAVRTVGSGGRFLRHRCLRAGRQSSRTTRWSCPIRTRRFPTGFYPVQVEIGIQDTYNVEIKSGLNEGDTVYTQMMTTEAWG